MKRAVIRWLRRRLRISSPSRAFRHGAARPSAPFEFRKDPT